MKKENLLGVKCGLGKQLVMLICLGGLLAFSGVDASAHKINIFAYVEGGKVYCEGYFPDGRAVEGGKVEVYESRGNKLLEGVTDKEGLFNFKAPQPDDLKIVLTASMGHKNSYALPAADFSEGSEAAKAPPEPTGTAEQKQAEQVQVKSRPRPRRAKKEPLPYAAILGGLGFIFGLTALIMQFTRKK